MKFGHALSDGPNHDKQDFADMELQHGGNRLSADDYDFDPEDFDDDLDRSQGSSTRFQGKGKCVKRLGVFMFVVGGVLNFMSFSYAAQR